MANDSAKDSSVSLFSVSEGARQLEDTVSMEFGFAWNPAKNSFVLIKSVKVDGRQVVPAGGAGDVESPYVVPLGRFSKDKKVEIEWSVRGFADLHGISAYVRVGRDGKWEQLGKEKAPLTLREEWTGKESFKVPS